MSSPQRSDALVVFGVTGDLAYKKIFPALLSLVAREQLNVPIVGVGRLPMPREELIDRVRKSVSARGAVDEAAFARLTSLLQYVSGDYGTLELFTEHPAGARRRSQANLLSRDSTERVSDDDRAPVERRLYRRRARRHREAVRARPRVGAIAERDAASRVFRRRDLPHRSLSRQGSGAEHPVFPVRQRVPRADLEPALRGERAHHDGRVVRRRGARRVLRGNRRRPRRGAEPSTADRRLPGDGAALVRVARSAARRAGEGAAHD